MSKPSVMMTGNNALLSMQLSTRHWRRAARIIFGEFGRKAYVCPLIEYSAVSQWVTVLDFTYIESLSARSRAIFKAAGGVTEVRHFKGFRSPALGIHLWKRGGFRDRYAPDLHQEKLKNHLTYTHKEIELLSRKEHVKEDIRKRFGLIL